MLFLSIADPTIERRKVSTACRGIEKCVPLVAWRRTKKGDTVHVLIIEDEPLIAMSIQNALEDAGATSFHIVQKEADAVNSARLQRPTFITSDVQLKEGNGPAAVKTIRHELGDIPVIFVTATPEQCMPCNPPGSILAKPFENDDLERAFRAAIAA
jgi:CheY-like chemotaxis protein